MSKQAALLFALVAFACGGYLGYSLGHLPNKNAETIVTPTTGPVPPAQPADLPPQEVLLYFHTWDIGETKGCYTRPNTNGNLWCDILGPKVDALNARMFSVKFSRPPWMKNSHSTREEFWNCTKDEHAVFTCTSPAIPKQGKP